MGILYLMDLMAVSAKFQDVPASLSINIDAAFWPKSPTPYALERWNRNNIPVSSITFTLITYIFLNNNDMNTIFVPDKQFNATAANTFVILKQSWHCPNFVQGVCLMQS